ncbi:substrate-binding domain-containing protein [Kiritimatiellaeota bacterium B1221]|nr:substrate-binding domain-containing protein [Kiritimatiellaeota bacterium B1221]
MPLSFNPDHQHIGLIGLHPDGYARWILEGFLAFTDKQPHWQLMHEPHCDLDHLENLLTHFQPDALLCESKDPEIIRRLSAWGKPVVYVASNIPRSLAKNLHRVRADNHAVGALAFSYLREKGFTRFLFAGTSNHPFSDVRLQGYRQSAEAAGYPVKCIEMSSPDRVESLLASALGSDPRPAALFAAHDSLGLTLVRAANGLGIPIPEALAILGVDNHALLCRISHPHLSSVDPGTDQMGIVCAERLYTLLQGEPLPPAEIQIPPVKVVTRRSTEVVSTDNPNLRRVFALIRERGCEDLTYQELISASHMSRRSLEIRYKEAFGFTLGQHITQVKVTKAKELLEHTDMYTPDIAAACGWPSASHMCVMFKRHTGHTPSDYRRKSHRDHIST